MGSGKGKARRTASSSTGELGAGPWTPGAQYGKVIVRSRRAGLSYEHEIVKGKKEKKLLTFVTSPDPAENDVRLHPSDGTAATIAGPQDAFVTALRKALDEYAHDAHDGGSGDFCSFDVRGGTLAFASDLRHQYIAVVRGPHCKGSGKTNKIEEVIRLSFTDARSILNIAGDLGEREKEAREKAVTAKVLRVDPSELRKTSF